MTERAWLAPSILLTALSGVIALLLMPDAREALPFLSLLPMWLIAAGAMGCLYSLRIIVAMMRAGEARPLARVGRLIADHRRRILFVSLCMALAGLNMISFMWTKPLLNHLVPFRADPWLAELDYWLFLGHDPWRLLSWLNSHATAIFYHRAWFALMILTLLMVLVKPASPRKSAVMMSYFLLWSVAGPLVHVAVPAAGPLFFERLGYGDRFAPIVVPDEISRLSGYLWTVYTGRMFGPGSGISAMPSLHIATTVWGLIAFTQFERRWLPLVAAIGLAIFLLSVSLGWHYAVDGIAGGILAVACYRGLLRLYESRDQAAGAYSANAASSAGVTRSIV